MNVLILAAGVGQPRSLLRLLAQRAQWLIAADGGVRLARRARLRVDQFVGDGDSLTPAERRWLEGAPFPVRWHPIDKDETDLELALALALARGPREVHVFGGWGRRADHTLSNVLVLERLAEADVEVNLWAGLERLRVLLPGEHRLDRAPVGQRVSLLPLSQTVEGITTRGLRFALRGEALQRTASRGLSNVVVSAPVELHFERGRLLVVQAYSPRTLKRAWAAPD